MKKLTTNEFIDKSNSIHGDKYDYSKVEYINSRTYVTIICPIHGEFLQSPNSHLSSQGCPECGGTKKLTTKEFIDKVISVHGDRYDYSKVEYKKFNLPITMICPTHGEFEIYPHSLVDRKNGCKKCSGNERHTRESFINKSIGVHGDRYDYSKVVYVNNKTYVTIICPIHGEFLQRPDNHLQGDTCSFCKMTKGEEKIIKSLKEYGVDYVYQKTFEECRDIRKLSFDFYIEEANTLIEYDGRQHFMPIKPWGGKEALETIKKHDKIKTNFAKGSKIELIRIPYWDYNNIEEILEDSFG